VLLAAGSVGESVWGVPVVAVAFGAFRWSVAAVDARLQERVGDGARATVTSLAGFGTEAVCMAVFGGYALGSAWAGPGVLMAVAAVPFGVVGVVVWAAARRG
jgi:hypothetical protein